MRDSIFYSSVRSFFITACAVIGFCLALVLMVLLISALSTTTETLTEPAAVYTPEIVPNAKGVRKVLSSDAPIILKLNISGIIGADSLNMSTFRTQLVESREGIFKTDRVKAILLHIESPGGTVTDADAIYHALKNYKEEYKVPVYAFVDGLCASGAMYIAASADKILATDVSLIGSIGVIVPALFNVSQLMEKVGVQSLTLYEGKGKDELNPFRPWQKGEDQNLKDAIAYYYASFVDIMTSNRPHLNKEKLINDYGANVYPAVIAQQYGYIDQAGVELHTAIDLLAKHIGIEDDFYQVVQLEKKSWYSDLFTGYNSLMSGTVKHELVLTPELSPRLMNQYLYLYRP